VGLNPSAQTEVMMVLAVSANSLDIFFGRDVRDHVQERFFNSFNLSFFLKK
jgi:hypothetical protein